MSKMRTDISYRWFHGISRMLAMSAFAIAFLAHAQERTLQSILREGLENDPAVLEAKANERVAEGKLAQTEASKWPTLAAKGNQAVLRQGGASQSFQPALEAQWTVYDFGKRDAQIRRDEIKTQYFANKTSETEQEFLYELAGHYLEALKAKMMLDVAQNNLARHKEIVRKLGIILEYDPGRRSEMTQAEARLLQVREQILSNQRLQSLALSRVARYVSPAVSPEELQDPFASLDAASLTEKYPVTEASLKQNPSYLAQAQELDGAKIELEVTELSRWPDINLLGEAKRHDSAVYLSVTFDVFDKSKAPSIDEKRSQVDAADARLKKILYNLLERAELASLKMQEDQLRIDIANNQITTLRQVAEDYEDQFEIAARSLLDVVNAYNELATIEQLKVQATYDLMSAKLDYLSAAGKIGEWAGIHDSSKKTPQVIIAGVNDGKSSGTLQQASLMNDKKAASAGQQAPLMKNKKASGTVQQVSSDDEQLIKVLARSRYYYVRPQW